MNWLSKIAETWDLRHDGKLLFRGSQNDCYKFLHKTTSCSWEHALQYEGYTINPTLEDWRKHWRPYPQNREKPPLY